MVRRGQIILVFGGHNDFLHPSGISSPYDRHVGYYVETLADFLHHFGWIETGVQVATVFTFSGF